MSTPAAWGIITPREPLVDANGMVTRSWWRFFEALFQLMGGYNPIPVPDVNTLTYLETFSVTPDSTRSVQSVETVLATLPNGAGRSASLESRVKFLETLLAATITPAVDSTLETRVKNLETLLAATISPTVDILPLQREADITQAYALGVH